MANNPFDHVNLVKAYILRSLHKFIFYGCLIMLIIHLLILLGLTYSDYEDIPNTEPIAFERFVSVTALIAFAIGCYAAFYKHQLSLKLFVIILFFGIVFRVLQLFNFLAFHYSKESVDKTFKAMSDFMLYYNWIDTRANRSTRAWNAMQKLLCCGVDGADDWVEYNPKPSPGLVELPSSCCPFLDMQCYKNFAFETGCRERWERMLTGNLLVYVFLILFLSILSYIVILSLNPSDDCFSRNSGQLQATVSQEGQQQALPNLNKKPEKSVSV